MAAEDLPPTPTEPPEDYFLQALVELVNGAADGGLSFGITLQMGGLLVSGTVIAGDKYFEQFGETFAGAFDNGDRVKQAIARFGDRYRDGRAGQAANDAGVGYIHLENCRFGDVNALSHFAPLWRGRIAEVDGFFLGLLAAD